MDDINNHKRKLANLYLQNLKADYVLPVVESGYQDVYHIFNIRHESRDALKIYLFDKGIGAEIHYHVPPHEQKAMQEVLQGQSFAIAKQIHETTLSLPCSYWHTVEQVERVIEVMNGF